MNRVLCRNNRRVCWGATMPQADWDAVRDLSVLARGIRPARRAGSPLTQAWLLRWPNGWSQTGQARSLSPCGIGGPNIVITKNKTMGFARESPTRAAVAPQPTAT